MSKAIQIKSLQKAGMSTLYDLLQNTNMQSNKTYFPRPTTNVMFTTFEKFLPSTSLLNFLRSYTNEMFDFMDSKRLVYIMDILVKTNPRIYEQLLHMLNFIDMHMKDINTAYKGTVSPYTDHEDDSWHWIDITVKISSPDIKKIMKIYDDMLDKIAKNNSNCLEDICVSVV